MNESKETQQPELTEIINTLQTIVLNAGNTNQAMRLKLEKLTNAEQKVSLKQDEIGKEPETAIELLRCLCDELITANQKALNNYEILSKVI